MKNKFRDEVEAAEAAGADEMQLRELLGKGRAKKGMFEGDLDAGELEIGQVASLLKGLPVITVEETMHRLLEEYLRAASKGQRDRFL